VNRPRPFKRVEKRLAGCRSVSTTAETSKRMGQIRRHGTRPELTVRSIVSSLGARYTLRNRDLPGSPDLANRTRKFAIFVNGCFWHRHVKCSKATKPKRNRRFWQAKFDRNVARDGAAIESLQANGFRVTTVWECELATWSVVRRRLKVRLNAEKA
jgi:DNA mismatch endonuclease, patch repair protein